MHKFDYNNLSRNFSLAIVKLQAAFADQTEEDVLAGCNGNEPAIAGMIGYATWNALTRSEKEAIISQLNSLTEALFQARALVLQSLVKEIIKMLSRAKTSQDIREIAFQLPSIVPIVINNQKRTGSTQEIANDLRNLIVMISGTGAAAKENLQNLLQAMQIRDKDLKEFPTLFSKPFYVAGVPVGINNAILRTIFDPRMQTEGDNLAEYYQTAVDIFDPIVQQGIRVRSDDFSKVEIIAPPKVLYAVFNSRFFSKEVLGSLTGDNVELEDQSTALLRDISCSGTLFRTSTAGKVLFWQILFSQATAEGLLSEDWEVFSRDEQLQARPIDDMPAKISHVSNFIQKVTGLGQFLKVSHYIQRDDIKFYRTHRTLWQHVFSDLKRKLEEIIESKERLEPGELAVLEEIFKLGFPTNLLDRFIDPNRRVTDIGNFQVADGNIEQLPPQDVRQLRTKNGYWSSVDLNDLNSFSHLSNIILPDGSDDQDKALKKSLKLPTGLGGFIQSAIQGTLKGGENSRIRNSNGTLYYRLEITGVVMNIAVELRGEEVIIDTNFTPTNKLSLQKPNVHTSPTERISKAEKSFKKFKKLLESLAPKPYLDHSDYEDLKKAIFKLQPYNEYYEEAKVLLGNMMEFGFDVTPTQGISNTAVARKRIEWLHLDLCDDRNPSYAKLAGDLMEYLTSLVWGRHAYKQFTSDAVKYLNHLARRSPAWVMNTRTADKGHFGSNDRTQIVRVLLENNPDQIGFAVSLDKHDH